MSLHVFKKLLPTGQHEVHQEDWTGFSYETYKRLPEEKQEKYKQEWIKAVINCGIDEGKFSISEAKIWPKSLNKTEGKSKDLCGYIDQHSIEHELINSNIFVKFYNNYIKGAFINDLKLKDFPLKQKILSEIASTMRIEY